MLDFKNYNEWRKTDITNLFGFILVIVFIVLSFVPLVHTKEGVISSVINFYGLNSIYAFVYYAVTLVYLGVGLFGGFKNFKPQNVFSISFFAITISLIIFVVLLMVIAL